ncbi:Vmc-like lipoprotein signal peptide domain-containing protein [Tenacibaculum sp. 190524A05c]|uniref:Vmc-like lipoprotein signal peptide domain-containing protein n=1 Tax=Tenacibaculum platacis TaxID=3137852 RepID=UPI0032B253AD
MKKILMLIIIAAIAVSCKDEEIIKESPQETIETEQRKEGKAMLHFDRVEELQSFIKERVSSDIDYLDEARNFSERGLYNPLLLVYNLDAREAEKKGIEEKSIPTVASDDDMLLLLLNEDGEIGIEDKIFRIDGDFVYTYTASGGSGDINNFTEQYNAGKIQMKRGGTLEFSKNLTVYMHDNVKSSEEENFVGRSQTNYQYFSNNYRMRARQFDGYWVFYSSIGSNTKVEERKKFLWWSWWKTAKTDNRLEYELSYEVRSTPGFPPVNFVTTASGFRYCNCNTAQRTYSWSVGVPWAPERYIPLEGESRHWAHWYTTNPNTVSVTLQY